jgi:hypothetical protein
MEESMNPDNVKIDLAARAAYIRYRDIPEESMTQLDVVREPDGIREIPVEEHDGCSSVIVDVDPAGNVIGIELLGFDDATAELAREYAVSRGLAFPRAIVAAASASAA